MIASLGLGIVSSLVAMLGLVASLEYELEEKLGLGQVASPGLGLAILVLAVAIQWL